jgi:hypothetical protein
MLDFIHYHDNCVIPSDVEVKLPLLLQPNDLLAKPRRGKIPTRPPNNFLIFRTAYTRVLQSLGYWDLKMREVTSHAAAAWKIASKEVRDECRRLALIAKRKHEEVYGPPPRQTRRRRNATARRQTKRLSSPTPAQTSSPSPIIYNEPTLNNPHPTPPSFYFDDLITPHIAPHFSSDCNDWQNIPFPIGFSPPSSELAALYL